MKLEDKVIGLEAARTIDELCKKNGIKLPQSEYSWECTDEINKEFYLRSKREIYVPDENIVYPAHDVAELGEILHDKISETRPCNAGWEVSTPVERLNHMSALRYSSEKTEATARGAMLIYLLKNHPEEFKKTK